MSDDIIEPTILGLMFRRFLRFSSKEVRCPETNVGALTSREKIYDVVGGEFAPDGHLWAAPHCVVFGPMDDPGVWHGPDGIVRIHRVCALCGAHLHIEKAPFRGNDPELSRTITPIEDLISDYRELTIDWLNEIQDKCRE